MLLGIFILTAVVVLSAVGLVIFKELSWQKMIRYLIDNALPMTDADVRYQVTRLIAKQEERKAIEKAKRVADRKRKKGLGKKADKEDGIDTTKKPREVY